MVATVIVSERAVGTSLPQHYVTFKQHNSLHPKVFFSIWLIEQKKILFEHINDIRDEPAVSLFNGLLINESIRYEI